MLIPDIHSYLYVRAYGPQEKKQARDTLALPARDFVPCTPDVDVVNTAKRDIANPARDFVPCTPDVRGDFNLIHLDKSQYFQL
jgi:hypothetical protein